jgi:hypothetical protein
MPSGDRTGPEGRGPMTGRSAGFCTGFIIPGYENTRYGFGRRLGRGLGRRYDRGYLGRGRSFWWRDAPPETKYPHPILPTTLSKDDEKAYLEDTVKNLEDEIKSIRKRIEEISKEKK